MDDAARFEHLRAVPDEHVRALFYDQHERLRDLEADQRMRQLIIAVAAGAAPLAGIIIGMFSGVRVSF